MKVYIDRMEKNDYVPTGGYPPMAYGLNLGLQTSSVLEG